MIESWYGAQRLQGIGARFDSSTERTRTSQGMSADPAISLEIFLITLKLYPFLVLLNSVPWMNLLKTWSCYWWMIGRVTSPVTWSILSPRERTTQIFQIFNIALLGILKLHPRYKLAFEREEPTLRFLLNGYHGFIQITVDFDIEEAVHRLVLEFNTGNKSDELLFNEEKLRQNASFQKPWSNNSALDYLSTRQDFTRFD
jgi:hypothetical protein